MKTADIAHTLAVSHNNERVKLVAGIGVVPFVCSIKQTKRSKDNDRGEQEREREREGGGRRARASKSRGPIRSGGLAAGVIELNESEL